MANTVRILQKPEGTRTSVQAEGFGYQNSSLACDRRGGDDDAEAAKHVCV